MDLQKKREELEKQYNRLFTAHCAKYNKYIAKEDEYRQSVKQIRNLYDALHEVALELGDPVPRWI